MNLWTKLSQLCALFSMRLGATVIPRKIPFVAKRPNGPEPWVEFGATKCEYEHWVDHVCGMACVQSLVLARHGASPSLWELTRIACKMGVYVESNGEEGISGAFHYPLVAMLGEYGIPASVFGALNCDQLVDRLAIGAVILSIDLAKVDSNHKGSHLVIVVARSRDAVIVHDNARILSETGSSVSVSKELLNEISNGRGILVPWSSLGGSLPE